MLKASFCGLPVLDAMHVFPPLSFPFFGLGALHSAPMGDLVCAILGVIPGTSSLDSSEMR